ncbi:tol [Fusarium tjaetaba]|uniref:Tol n=1 Tax=Fusarium tjaetaba TaxID=1567544 RepID=A0A8H5VW84_9HYPO|nr:tol [Fusarium tjaetaba]KAF5636680.1 tol [Fusarium tjaetaba]
MTSSSELPTYVILWDFDEDVSDLDETNADEAIAYNGPGAAEYQLLRGKREERKRELCQRKDTIRKRREDAGEEEKNKTDQVRVVYEVLEISMSRSESSRLGPIDSQFDLHFMDYFDRFYDPSPHGYQRRYIRFEYQDRGEAHRDNLTGRFWLNPSVDLELVPLIYTPDGRSFMSLQFIDKDNLILKASRDLVFWATPQDSQGPDTFTFMGVRNDRCALAPPTKFLSVQDETLCEFCHDDALIPLIRTRALSDLTESSRYCQLCAMWLRALDHSRQNLKVRGQVALLRQHPLEQDISDVALVFMSSSVLPYIVWPHMGYAWATLDAISTDGAKDINLKPLPRSDQADATWKSVREWLGRCQKYHKDCKLQRTPTWKPTRLLYVCNTQAALQVRLVEGQELPDGTEYLTLSHCLGVGNTLQLTRSNIEAFKSSIPVDELSRVFIDACNTTKRLSHEYLWIDALCIIQDDPTDREHEVGCMSSIYGNSCLNLSADGDDAADQGLFCPSSKRALHPWYPVYIRRERGHESPRDYCISEYHNWWERISNSKLNRGACALQERVLPPRVLHLGLEQVALECCSNAVCERLPYGDPTIREDTAVLTSLKRFVLDARNGNLSSLSPETAFRNWNQIVQAYSQGQLTIATDRLVALSGLIDVLYPVFQQMTEREDEVEDRQTEADSLCHNSTGLFLAGLWRPYAERQLVWRAMSRDHPFTYDGNALSVPGKRYDEYIAPTWSWCSVKDAAIVPQELRSGNIYFTKVIDTNIIPDKKLNPATHLSSMRYCSSPGSFLRLRCSYLTIVELGPVSGMKLMNFRAATHERGRGEEAIDVQSRNYWDVEFSQEAIDCKSPIAVPIFARTDFSNCVYCLALDERRGENGHIWYIRLGAFVITYPEDVTRFWEGIEEFDKHMPEECARHDGLHRFKDLKWGKCTYVKMDEVLQRIIEIR